MCSYNKICILVIKAFNTRYIYIYIFYNIYDSYIYLYNKKSIYD